MATITAKRKANDCDDHGKPRKRVPSPAEIGKLQCKLAIAGTKAIMRGTMRRIGALSAAR